MIFIVDEDVSQLRPYVFDLEISGYSVKQITNAYDAYHRLTGLANNEVHFILIDVMLAAGEECEMFTKENTDNYQSTGIELLKRILHKKPEFVNRICLFSMTKEAVRVKRIQQIANRYKIQFIRKSDYKRPSELTSKMKELISGNR